MPLNFRILLSVRQSLVLMTELPCRNIHQHLQTALLYFSAGSVLQWVHCPGVSVAQAPSQLPYLFNNEGTVSVDIFLFSFYISETPIVPPPQPAWEGRHHFAGVTCKLAELYMGETGSTETSITSLCLIALMFAEKWAARKGIKLVKWTFVYIFSAVLYLHSREDSLCPSTEQMEKVSWHVAGGCLWTSSRH